MLTLAAGLVPERSRPGPSPSMSAVMVDVAVVVVTYNSARHIGALLNSLPAALGSLSHTTVVVDNGSWDESAAIVESRGDCTLVRSENVGYAAGVNVGVRRAGPSRAILVLNPDARLEPGSAHELFGALAEGVGIAAPRVTSEPGELVLSLRREPTLRRASGLGFTGLPMFSEYVTDPAAYRRAHTVDWALGAVLLIDRDCFDALSGFDESFFLYSEETDFCLRARDMGWRTMYVPSAGAMHIGGGSGQTGATHAMQIVNRVRLYRRRHGDVRAWLYLGLTVLSEVTWVARGHRHSWTAVVALVRPSRRPEELRCGAGILPA